MEKDVAALRSEIEQLERGLVEMREGSVIANQGELLAQTALGAGAVSADMDEAFDRLIRTAEETLTLKNRESGVLKNAGPPLRVAITPEERKKLYDFGGPLDERKLLRLTAPSNVVQGQVVNGILEIHTSRLIFRKDDVLMTETVRRGMAQGEAADTLYTMLKRINRRAVSQGVLPDPITGTVGNLDTLDFYDAVDKISESEEDRGVTFLASEDIYTEGPVGVKIVVDD
jgi:hypothetical protein